MWSSGTGSEIMQRIAVPMIGGMISSTLLTLIVIPAVFGLLKGFGLPGDSVAGRPAAAVANRAKKVERAAELVE
jgi:Cu(I)/Ag(I) efflux system membrane protein CusA/SilA